MRCVPKLRRLVIHIELSMHLKKQVSFFLGTVARRSVCERRFDEQQTLTEQSK